MTVPQINGKTSVDDIAEHFAQKYKALFNKSGMDTVKRQLTDNYINEGLNSKSDNHEIEGLSPQDVKAAIRKLRRNKSDGDIGFNSSHLLLAGEALHYQVSQLFQAIFVHGHQPERLMQGTIASIPKDLRGNLCIDSNYRGIALSNAIGKVLDMIILSRNKSQLKTSGLQFAYKPKFGTVVCTLMLKEIIKYYNQNGSSVYCCSLDMSKAFDVVRHDDLLFLLKK